MPSLVCGCWTGLVNDQGFQGSATFSQLNNDRLYNVYQLHDNLCSPHLCCSIKENEQNECNDYVSAPSY